MVATRRDN